MAYALFIFTSCAALGLISAYNGPDLPPGPYCGAHPNKGCCIGRQDHCHHNITAYGQTTATLCYCDTFCDQRTHDDCCPDYYTYCHREQRPENIIKGECLPNKEKMKECNKCTCGGPGTPKWNCEEDPCLYDGSIVSNVNRDHWGWRAKTYPEYANTKLSDALIYRLGTLPSQRETDRMGAIRHDNKSVPPQYDPRTTWPERVTPIVDQGWCGSDWAVTIAAVASDRLAIFSKGAEIVQLSPQQLLSCTKKQNCSGGHIDIAWPYAKNVGLVGDVCFPYKAKETHCFVKKHDSLHRAGCRATVPQRTGKYKVGPAYKLNSEKDIMYDIFESGPVHAIMTVYQDFFHYSDGIYRHTPHGNNQLHGLHSVRIIGWGQERGRRGERDNKYWIVANSWGEHWGENGYFRIARGLNESGIESFVVSAWSEVAEANKRK